MVLEGRTFVAVRTSDAAGPGGRQTLAQGPQKEHDRTTGTFHLHIALHGKNDPHGHVSFIERVSLSLN